MRNRVLLFCLLAGSLFITIAAGVRAPINFQDARPKRDSTNWNPVANPAAVVKFGNARFTLLTDYLVRLEYSNSTTFDDRASFFVVNRFFAKVPSFYVKQANNTVMIKTSGFVLTYNNSGPFSKDNLKISFKVGNKDSTWYPSMSPEGNLFGTVRTLDRHTGPAELDCNKDTDPNSYCTYGMISRNGWVLVDDSTRPRMLNNADWGEWVDATPTTDLQDWYFFGYGRNYKLAMKDFTRVGGDIPLPPRYMFGIFFSRYWAYSDVDSRDLIKQYETHQVPLDVLVTDMDWHETFYKEAAQGEVDQAGLTVGWTGYTWDSKLFPNPGSFLDFCKNLNLRNTLNLHPASGVQPHEALYPEMARAMGQDPSLQRYVPFNITYTKYAQNLMDIMLKPVSDQGVDFWWLDWQQYGNTAIANVNPTFWLNHVFWNNFKRTNSLERPTILHRWGGLGNHRYQIGFSGDTTPTWEMLNFQPYFTATAANVGYSYWSHDIGGHEKPSPPEMYTRWVQFGILSPAFRPHTTKNALSDRRIWVYPEIYFEIMRDAIVLRSSLVPYLYTAARITYEEGVSAIVRPLYYEYPENDNAYNFQNEYFFGTEFIASPVTAPMNNATQLSPVSVWFPTGTWIDWYAGRAISSPEETFIYQGNYSLPEIPIFAKAGAIVPYAPTNVKALFGSAQNLPNRMGLMIFVDSTGDVTESTGRVYDDAGNTNGYLRGEYAWTEVLFSQVDSTDLYINVEPVERGYPTMTKSISYEIKLLGCWPATSVKVNGNSINYVKANNGSVDGYNYNGNELATVITIATEYSRVDGLQVEVQLGNGLSPILLSGIKQKIARAEVVKVLFDYQWGIQTIYQEDYPNVIRVSETGDRMTDYPETAFQEISQFEDLYQQAIEDVKKINYADPSVIATALALLTNQA